MSASLSVCGVEVRMCASAPFSAWRLATSTPATKTSSGSVIDAERAVMNSCRHSSSKTQIANAAALTIVLAPPSRSRYKALKKSSRLLASARALSSIEPASKPAKGMKSKDDAVALSDKGSSALML